MYCSVNSRSKAVFTNQREVVGMVFGLNPRKRGYTGSQCGAADTRVGRPSKRSKTQQRGLYEG